MGDVCDEGGSHEFKAARAVTAADWLLCISCFPCIAFISCACSNGAALANPAFEELCCVSRDQADKDKGQAPTCVKCGLSLSESTALNAARRNELKGNRTSRPAGFFNQEIGEELKMEPQSTTGMHVPQKS